MGRSLATLAVGCSLLLALSPRPARAMGLFNEHGSLHREADRVDHATPEIDPGAAQSAVALLIAGLLILAARRRG